MSKEKGSLMPPDSLAPPPLLPAPEPEVDATYRILLENDRFAIVAKSGNLPCHPGGRYRLRTLEALLVAGAGFPAAHFVGRLDRETSGAAVADTEQIHHCGRADRADDAGGNREGCGIGFGI